jgi:hypothetical protein
VKNWTGRTSLDASKASAISVPELGFHVVADRTLDLLLDELDVHLQVAEVLGDRSTVSRDSDLATVGLHRDCGETTSGEGAGETKQ